MTVHRIGPPRSFDSDPPRRSPPPCFLQPKVVPRMSRSRRLFIAYFTVACAFLGFCIAWLLRIQAV